MQNTIEYIQSKLFEMQDEKYRDFQCRLMPTIAVDTVIGVRTPVLRKFAKEIAKSPLADEFLAVLPHKYYEENNLHGFLIETIKDFDIALAATCAFLPYVDNWATCDIISPKVFAKNTDRLLPQIKEWIASDKTYTCRFGIEMLMSYYLGNEFLPEYLELVAVVRSDEYYVNMMIAWFFATALTKQFDATIPYLQTQHLDTWTHNKAIQKAIESLRISDECKTYLRTLKVK